MNRNAVYAISSILCVVGISAVAKPTLCQADEDVLFSCTASKKLISVCASKDLEADPMSKLIPLLLLSASGTGSAQAAVTEITSNGFSVHEVATSASSPQKAYQALTHDVGHWWNPAHTLSGDSRNLSIASPEFTAQFHFVPQHFPAAHLL